MIKTTTAVSYDNINPSKKEIAYGKVTSTNRDDENELYTLFIENWVETQNTQSIQQFNEIGEPILNEQGEITFADETFTQKTIIRNHSRVMTFEQVEQLTAYIDATMPITEVGSYARKKYTELGHLLVNNQENVMGTTWELV